MLIFQIILCSRFGQPTHFYDYSHIDGGIVIRRAKKDEQFTTLNDDKLVLNENNLVIADHKKVLGLAGIIGGKSDSILDNTKKIVIEMANFEGLNIRSTTQEYGLRTEASMRFEKQIDIERIDLCFAKLFNILKKYYPDIKIVGFKDVLASYLNKNKEKKIIELKQSFLNIRLR